MPTITYDKKDLLNLIGRKLSDLQLVETINSIKPSVENIDKKEITVEHTADRIDLLGIEGLARAIRQCLGIEKGLKQYKIGKPRITIRVESVPVRPYVASAVIKNVKLTDEMIKSLMNIQEILHETIGRDRRKVAIGIHDLDKIYPPITYTGVSKDTKMIPLGFSEEMSLEEVLEKVEKGKKYGKLISSGKKWPVFVDKKGIFSFPPIINSNRTRVTEKTKNLFLDITGIDRKAVKQTLNIIVTNLAERKCKIEAVKLKYKIKTDILPKLENDVIEVEKNQINKLLGLNLSENKIVELLEKMGYHVVISRGRIEVIIPSYRVDILHPVDIIEDIAIAYGYNNFVPELPKLATIGEEDRSESFSNRLRELMIGFGFQEIMRPILTNLKEQFDRMCLNKTNVITLENPVSENYTCLRVWLLPDLLSTLSSNKHVIYPQNLFELGDVVIPDEKTETKSKDIRKLAFVISHGKVSFPEIKSIVENILSNLGIKNYKFKEVKHPSFIKGRVAKVVVNSNNIGIFGEIHPLVLENWKIEMPTGACEITIDNLAEQIS